MDNSVEPVDNLEQNKPTKGVLGIFAKQPLPGQVKTRLCPPLMAAEAADLYRESLCETVERLQQGRGYDVVICYAGQRSWFEDHFTNVSLMAQQGEHLGERMARALDTFLEHGYRKAVLVGSDSPDLPLANVEQAFTSLEEANLVLGPATDGGYYLVGEAVHHPELFVDIPWSSDQVFDVTLEKADRSGLKVSLLNEWEDLDDVDALVRFRRRNSQGRTLRFINSRLAHCLPGAL